MKYTKAERHEIYKRARTKISNDDPFVCNVLKYITKKQVDYEYCVIVFPELVLFHTGSMNEIFLSILSLSPKDVEFIEYKKTVLEFCIEMTR